MPTENRNRFIPSRAECAGDQGKYWEMHERLFKNQQTLGAKDHSGHAASVGLDVSRFELCLETGKFAAKVSADMASGTKLKVAGTPAFYFGYVDEKDPTRIKAVKLLTGAQPLTAFKEVLDALLNPPNEQAAAR
jgi:protein-disulfide isomerase